MQRYKILVSGKVQGVYFRYSAKKIADELKIGGYVQNLPDGSVLIEGEGSEEALEKFTAWCRKGPEKAKVLTVSVQKLQPVGYHQFLITH
jgi:acylphosphatase